MDGAKFPRRKADAILRRTMKVAGYSPAFADVGVWSANWLEERYHSGVTKLIVYLCLTKGQAIDDLRPRKHPQWGLAGICPFMMAEAVILLAEKWMPRGRVAFGAPAEPFLMMASVADWASTKGCSVRFRHLNYSCLMSNKGIDIETDDLSLVGWCNPDSDHPMEIELTNEQPEAGFRRIRSVSLPAKRLRGRAALDLT